jgi:hypothetical protein
MCAALYTNQPNSRAPIAPRCTPVVHPQRPNKGRTVVNAVIHTPTTVLAAPRPSCPQNPHPLILLLSHLCCFFFEVQRWGCFVTLGSEASRRPGLSGFAISFQDGLRSSTVVLRLPLRVVVVPYAPPTFVGGRPQRAGRLATGFSVGEGTLWTRRRQLASSI